jgi:predicted negative regulator of RcsB-dependent stress response
MQTMSRGHSVITDKTDGITFVGLVGSCIKISVDQGRWYMTGFDRVCDGFFDERPHRPDLTELPFGDKAHFEIVRGNAGAARRDAEMVVKLSQEIALTLYAALGALQSAWASARLDVGETGATALRQAFAAYTDQGNKFLVPFYQGLLAEIEAQGNAERALARIDEALALAAETGEHWSDAFLHRLRGEILLKRDPANTAPAEEASSLQSPSPNNKRHGVLSCARRSRWRSFINRPVVLRV